MSLACVYQPGDTVALKSGGQHMTVTKSEYSVFLKKWIVFVVWTTADGKVQRDSFVEDELAAAK